jgi:hypothetical protein
LAQSEVYFGLPQSSIRGIPLYSGEERLGFSFIEVGCNPRNKCGQLNDKRTLFHQYWGTNYRRKEMGIDWSPFVFRCLSHYGKRDSLSIGRRGPAMDVVLHYGFISPEMLADLTEEDKEKIFRAMGREIRRRGTLEEILSLKDGERLHQMIVSGGDDPALGSLRGKMAEILALKDVDRVLPSGMNLYQNGEVRYFNQRYRNGTEIDGIMTFYGEEMFLKLLEALHQIDHLHVRDRWH